MSKKIIFMIFITIIIVILTLAFLVKIPGGNLISPNLPSILKKPIQTSSPIPTPIPSPTPKIFNFDASSDLKGELETVNPQVLDSDFE